MKVSFQKPNYILIVLVIILSAGILNYQNNKINKKLNLLIDKKNLTLNQFKYDSLAIIKISNEIDLNYKKIPEEQKSLDNSKKIYDIRKLNPIRGYSITSYSTRRGNTTNTRNYIHYK